MRTVLLVVAAARLVAALERPDVEFKIFQFPANQIPRIDGKTDDWAMVPARYAIGSDQLKDTVNSTPRDPKDLDVYYAGSNNGVKRFPYSPTMMTGGAGEDVVTGQPTGGRSPRTLRRAGRRPRPASVRRRSRPPP